MAWGAEGVSPVGCRVSTPGKIHSPRQGKCAQDVPAVLRAAGLALGGEAVGGSWPSCALPIEVLILPTPLSTCLQPPGTQGQSSNPTLRLLHAVPAQRVQAHGSGAPGVLRGVARPSHLGTCVCRGHWAPECTCTQPHTVLFSSLKTLLITPWGAHPFLSSVSVV